YAVEVDRKLNIDVTSRSTSDLFGDPLPLPFAIAPVRGGTARPLEKAGRFIVNRKRQRLCVALRISVRGAGTDPCSHNVPVAMRNFLCEMAVSGSEPEVLLDMTTVILSASGVCRPVGRSDCGE